MDIRPAQASDLSSIRKCAEAAYGKYVERIGKRPAPMIADFAGQVSKGIVHILLKDSMIAGFVVFYRRGDHVHLESVAVDPAFQNRGYGLQLINHVEKTAVEAGVQAVELYTNAKMTENLSFYPRLGYEETGRRIEDGFDRVFFRKALAAHASRLRALP